MTDIRTGVKSANDPYEKNFEANFGCRHKFAGDRVCIHCGVFDVPLGGKVIDLMAALKDSLAK